MRANTRDTGTAPVTTLPQLLTIADVCDLLGRSRASVYRDMARGDIPAITVGHSRRVVASDLQAYIAARQVEARGEIVLYAPVPQVPVVRPSHSATHPRTRGRKAS